MSPRVLASYRVMAYVTGVLLIVLTFVAMPMKYFAHEESLVRIVGITHGWVYMIYVITALTLAYQLRWPLVRALLVLLAGTVPFASFVAERSVRAEAAARSGSPATGGSARSPV